MINNNNRCRYSITEAHRFLALMGLPAMRFLDGELDEKKREEREDGGLQKTDEYLEKRKDPRYAVGSEKESDGNDDRACEDVTEKPERERDEADEFANE